MHTVRLDIKDSVFDQVMFLLKNLPKNEVKVRVEKKSITRNSDDIVSFFQNSPLKNEVSLGTSERFIEEKR